MTSRGAIAAVLVARLFIASTASAQLLDIVEVSFPNINCVFDLDCTITVQDTVDEDFLPGFEGGFVQSRTFPPGESGTLGEGLIGYLYRIDLRDAVVPPGVTVCLDTFALPFVGALTAVDFDGDALPDDVFVATDGGLGSVAPSTAERDGDAVVFAFEPEVCVDETSFFFGFASAASPVFIQAQILLEADGGQLSTLANVRVPALATRPPLNGWIIMADVLGDFGTGAFAASSGRFATSSNRIAENRRTVLNGWIIQGAGHTEVGRLRPALQTALQIFRKVDGRGRDWIVDDSETSLVEPEVLLMLSQQTLDRLLDLIEDDEDD